MIEKNFEITRTIYSNSEMSEQFLVKFGLIEKHTKFEKIFHLKFDITEYRQILWPSQKSEL